MSRVVCNSFFRSNFFIVLGCVLLVVMYMAVFFIYATDTPYIDDYYDILYFFHQWQGAQDIGEKISLLFWKYNLHPMVLNRLVYLGYMLLNTKVDFFYLSMIGTAQLLPAAWLLWRLINLPQSSTRLPLLLVMMCMLSFAHWQSAFWAMASISDYAAVFLAIVIVYCLYRGGHGFILLAWILAYAKGNGIVLLLLATIPVLMCNHIAKRDKYIWYAVSASLLLFYVATYQDAFPVIGIDRSELLLKMLSIAPQILLTFLGLIGAMPFQTTDGVMLPPLAGMALLAAHAGVMRYLFYTDRNKFYALIVLTLYLLVSLFTISSSVIFNGYAVMVDSHYKIYSVVFYAMTLGLLLQIAQHRIARIAIMCIVTAMLLCSYIRDIPQIHANSQGRQHDMAEWAIQGDHASVGGGGWVPLSEQLLFASVREGIYSPFYTARGAQYQHRQPIALSTCPTKIDTDVSQPYSVILRNRHGTVGAEIRLPGNDNTITDIFLCGKHVNYQLMPRAAWVNRIVIDKTQLQPGDYVVYLKSSAYELIQLKTALHVDAELPGLPCDTDWSSIQIRVRTEVEAELCSIKHQN